MNENATFSIKLFFAGLLPVICTFLGGWDTALMVLLVFIGIDYATGVLSAICNKQLSSEIGFKGIAKKVGIMVLVGAANYLGQFVGYPNEIRTIVIGFYIANEGISILENLMEIGLDVPNFLKKLLEKIKSDADSGNKKDGQV